MSEFLAADGCLKLDHIGLFTPDLQKSIDFYRELFGFEELFRVDEGEDGEFDIAVIGKDEVRIELLQFRDPSRDVCAAAMACQNHFAIRCRDTKAAVKLLKEKNVEFETEEDIYVAGFGDSRRDIDVVFLHGPGGERIELYQEIWKG